MRHRHAHWWRPLESQPKDRFPDIMGAGGRPPEAQQDLRHLWPVLPSTHPRARRDGLAGIGASQAKSPLLASWWASYTNWARHRTSTRLMRARVTTCKRHVVCVCARARAIKTQIQSTYIRTFSTLIIPYFSLLI